MTPRLQLDACTTALQPTFPKIKFSSMSITWIRVLVDDASMPRASDLPDDVKSLVRRNAVEVSHTRFSADSERLISAVEKILGAVGAQERGKREEQESVDGEKCEREEKQPLEAERREHESHSPYP